MNHNCNTCDVSFKSDKLLQQHLKCSRHINRLNKPKVIPRFECNACGKKYSIRQSLHAHKKICVAKVDATTIVPTAQKDATSVQEILHQQQIDDMKQAFIKERIELKLAFEETMKEQMNKLLEKHAGTTNNTLNTNNNIETQNINIIINAFGNENTDYIDDKSILACIDRVYRSIPSLLEKIHFDPAHPENHNIKITNKKLPYASVMGNNKKWKTVDRKDAIDTMVSNGYNMLDEKYSEHKGKLAPNKQQKFEGFLSRFESEDKEVLKKIKSDVELLVLNA